MSYAAATLGEVAALVIGTHVSLCETCHAYVETCEALGGALLDDLEPANMAPDAFAKVLQEIDSESRKAIMRRSPRTEIVPDLPLPEMLDGYAPEKWRFLAPGLRYARIATKTSDNNTLFLLRATPGAFLPEHGHNGDEFICVLKGSFSDNGGRYVPGDLAVADASIQHKPRVELDGECICLVALEGGLRLRSVVGRMLQPVLGL